MEGSARLNLFRHRHEIQSGRTSSISREILGFDSKGLPITYNVCRTPEEICESSSKLITFIDLGGHQKYLKTTVFGLIAMNGDYAVLCVSAIGGVYAGTVTIGLIDLFSHNVLQDSRALGSGTGSGRTDHCGGQ